MDRKISLVTNLPVPDNVLGKAALPKISQINEISRSVVSSSVISKNIKETVDSISKPIFDANDLSNSYAIDEIELNFVVDVKGGVSLIANSSIGIQASVKIKVRSKK